MSSFNNLSEAEQERLSILLEECGEVIQIIGKIQRHGYSSTDPTNPSCPGNCALLEKEVGDVLQAIDLMTGAKDIDAVNIKKRVNRRWKSVQKYIHHQPQELFNGIGEL